MWIWAHTLLIYPHRSYYNNMNVSSLLYVCVVYVVVVIIIWLCVEEKKGIMWKEMEKGKIHPYCTPFYMCIDTQFLHIVYGRYVVLLRLYWLILLPHFHIYTHISPLLCRRCIIIRVSRFFLIYFWVFALGESYIQKLQNFLQIHSVQTLTEIWSLNLILSINFHSSSQFSR